MKLGKRHNANPYFFQVILCVGFLIGGMSLSGCVGHKTEPSKLSSASAPVALKGEDYLTQVEANLRDQIHPAGISFLRDGQQLLLIVQCNLLFDTDQYEFRYTAAQITDPLIKELTTFPPAAIDIKSYTDSLGPLSWNQRLSEYRANSLKDLLVSSGMGADKIQAQGFGPQNPIETNSTELGRRANRRLEIRISPPN